jgi:hypothetical protein
LEYCFRTSYYATFSEKIKDFDVKKSVVLANGDVEIQLTNRLDEYWEPNELTAFSGNLLVRADLRNNSWYYRECRNKVYGIFPSMPVGKMLQRDTSILGYPPCLAVSLRQERIAGVLLTQANISHGKPMVFGCDAFLLRYSVPSIVASDLEEIKASILPLNGVTSAINQSTINQYVKLFTGSTPGHSGSSNAEGAMGNAGSAMSSGKAGNVKEGIGNGGVPQGRSGDVVSNRSIQNLKLAYPSRKSEIPLIWEYNLPGKISKPFSYSSYIPLP